MINLTNDYSAILLSDYPAGKTQNIEVRIGRHLYYIDIEKSAGSAYIEMYKHLKPATKRSQFSKYDPEAERYGVTVKADAMVGKDFLLHLPEIEQAQWVLGWYDNIVK